MPTRRTFLQSSLAAAAALTLPRTAWSQTSPAKKLTLSVPLTHSDWMLKPNIQWGPAGVKHMLDACRSSGWSHVHWRVTDGGRAMYPSKVMRPGDQWDDDAFWSPKTDADRALVQKFGMTVPDDKRAAFLKKFADMDYSKFDALGEAVRYGHSIGLKIHAWVTINEDDHGWGLVSDFARAHPRLRWHKRDGTPYHSQLSFAYPEVRDYKLSILKELLTTYDLDGLFLDWIRTGDVRDNPQTDPDGVANYGYEQPNLDEFKKSYGEGAAAVANNDPRWVQLRAKPHTQFMRDARRLVKSHNPSLPIAVLVGHPWHYRGLLDKIDGNLRGYLLDLPTWSKENLIDAAVPAGYYRDGGTPDKAYNALKSELGPDSKADVWTYGWVPTTPAQFETDANLTRNVGATQLLLWEADYIDDRPNKDELQRAMRAASSA